MRYLFFCLFLMFIGSFYTQAQKITLVKISEVEQLMQLKDDTTRVLNLWTTWCGPCVKELPYFEDLHQQSKEKKLKVILLAVEDSRDKVEKFIQKKNMQAKVLLLDEKDANMWIPKIDKDWQGDIPVTLFLNGSKNTRKFINGELTPEKIKQILTEFN